ncbi:MAG TPA: SDR family oxidoreductase [Allosphingosinicella sp.]|jgi:NAD(P)-dependent dehydrogenase (short-subunit alcohol dehydrogenase family)
MATILITGAGRGIGLEFARQYAADGWDVIATVRDPAQAEALTALGVRVERLDMRDFGAVEAFPERLGGAPLDLFIANAGMSAGKVIDSAANAAAWSEVHAVNAIAPTLLATRLLPNVAAADGKMVAITSQMGSIAGTSGGHIAYRASKAALNAAWRALSLDWRDQPVTLAMFHPGWVQTDMGGPHAPLSPGDSVASMRGVIERLTRADSGSFLGHKGETIPW